MTTSSTATLPAPDSPDYEDPAYYQRQSLKDRGRSLLGGLRYLTNPLLGQRMTAAVIETADFDGLAKIIKTTNPGRTALVAITGRMFVIAAEEKKSRGMLYRLRPWAKRVSAEFEQEVLQAILDVSPAFEDAYQIHKSTMGPFSESARQHAIKRAKKYSDMRLLWGDLTPEEVRHTLRHLLDAANLVDETLDYEAYRSLLDDASGDEASRLRILAKMAAKTQTTDGCIEVWNETKPEDTEIRAELVKKMGRLQVDEATHLPVAMATHAHGRPAEASTVVKSETARVQQLPPAASA